MTRTGHKKFTVVSLFSGCGGMDLGFIGGFSFLGKKYPHHDFEIIWANDLNAAACNTYKLNLGHNIHLDDIWNKINTLPAHADIVIGGFPCQDISVNGKGAGIQGKRSGLYRAMVAAIEKIRPRIFIAENVKGLLMQPHAKDLEKILHDFQALGYKVTYKLHSVADYGVPQTRERVIITGTRDDMPDFSHPDSILKTDEHISAKTAIHDLAHLDENPEINHIWSRAGKSPDQGSRKLREDRPGYTIRAECHGNIQWHYELPRRISMREAARIQSFPDDFIFCAGLRETERQIGNAVPPVFAWHIAHAVAGFLNGGQNGGKIGD